MIIAFSSLKGGTGKRVQSKVVGGVKVRARGASAEGSARFYQTIPSSMIREKENFYLNLLDI